MILQNLQDFYSRKKLFIIGSFISAVICYLDLLTKEIAFNAVDKISLTQNLYHIKVTDFFNIVKVWNNGVSFGMFNNLEYGRYIFVVIVAIIAAIMLVWMYKSKNSIVSYALSFIIGGAFGNMIDRMVNSAVADFLDFHIYGYHWPAFNLADSAVFIGVAMLIFDDLILKKKKDEKTN